MVFAAQNSNSAVVPEWWRDLPFDFQSVSVVENNRPIGFRYYAHSITIVAEFQNQKIFACGEDNNLELASTKAIAELVERAALIDWLARHPDTKCRSSNGWAAHRTVKEAKEAAVRELIERDAVLAHWYTSTPFIEVDYSQGPSELIYWQKSELSKSEFPNLRILISTMGFGSSVTCLLTNTHGYGVVGHSANGSLDDCVGAAIGEACRAAHMAIRRTYLRDTDILRIGVSRDAHPFARGLYYAYQEPFPSWMFGERYSWSEACLCWADRRMDLGARVRLSEFQFQKVMSKPFSVGFASYPNVLRPKWESTPDPEDISILQSRFDHMLGFDKLNLKPHLIS